ncbi:MAG: dihydrolipoyllysine-residue succinyltransferase [Prosthecobacter sp.]|uniref:dihydrolipoyllysine-residue succinyltransferase n=1 Tax=Prosthecobacter sp. TaxID=1965333 RepID=UPI0025CDF238|nr:dihydrolipoyllysine-residue succinyltransferase [Prosthecobacter sp.]MCF7785799.1 dihydrolipoyllysine-residue succinyltransferase [Prosthecobacter sp.]
MPSDIKIPALGESVAGGQIAKWHFNEGDFVKTGDILLTLETDKVAAEVTAESSGALHIGKQAGDDVEVGAVVGQIDESAAAPAAKAEAPKAAPAAAPAAKAEPEKPANVTEFKVVPKPEPAPVAKAAPAAPEGRITRKKMSPLRKKIADQLVTAQRTAAILTTFNECDMSNVMALRSKLQDSFVKKNGVKLGFMSFFIKAVVEALKAVPQVNVRVEGEEIVQQHFFDIGVAVGTERGLIVPVLRDADQKSFAELEKDILGYAAKSKEGKIQVSDLTGGVFTISNGGVYGSLLSTPIINPPQSAILGMHSIQQRPVAVDGQVVIRPMMYLALSYDHRVVDGKEAVAFLIRIKDCIENPARMLVGA